MMRKVFFTALILLACNSNAFSENVPKIETSEFDSVVRIKGQSDFDNPFGGIAKEWFIRSSIDKKSHKVLFHQIYVSLLYRGSWAFYDFATDDNAQTLKLTKIDQSVVSCYGGCSYTEEFGIEVSDVELRSRSSGFQIRVTSQKGAPDIILAISPSQIIPQIEAADDFLAASNAGPSPGAVHIGAQIAPVGGRVARIAGLKPNRGMVVVTVNRGEPFDLAGIKPDDLIIAINGTPVNTYDQLNKMLLRMKKPSPNFITIERSGQQSDIPISFSK